MRSSFSFCRNLTLEEVRYLRGKRYEFEKQRQGAPAGNHNAEKQSDQNDQFVLDCSNNGTADNIAKEYNVSSPTIRRDEKYAKGLDVIGGL